MVYLSLLNTKDDFTVAFGQQKVHLDPSSHIRLQVEQSEAKLAVLDGSARVEGPSGTVEAAKKKTLVFNLADANAPVVAKNNSSDPFDSWDHDSAEYHKKYAAQSALASSTYSYGGSDLAYYGSFVNGSCGMMWQPYFVSAGWDPFANGMWAFYPGAGYSWVSPYPWGWTPYHSGNWVSCPGMGWGWQPGGSWTGLGNQPIAMQNGQPIRAVQPPAREPAARGYVVVNTKPLATSTGSGDSFVFRKDSAGFGVPRGSLGRLDYYSKDAVHHGSMSIPVFAGFGGMYQGSSGHSAQAGRLVQSPHVGVAPYQSGIASSSTAPGAGGTTVGYGHPSIGAVGTQVNTPPAGGTISGSKSGGGSPK
jgi:hypothetical protein